jgi:hypothetical protein
MAGVPAMAGTLCPSDAAQGGFGGTYTAVPGATGPGGVCTAGGITMAIPTNGDEGKLVWAPGDSGYPSVLTFSNLGSLDASVANASGDQP